MSVKSKVVAIDGPSGSGKSTIAKLLAKSLGLTYLDTGSMFRAIAYHLHEKQIPFDAVEKIEQELKNLQFEYAKDDQSLVAIDGVDLTQKIREHIVSSWASQVSQISCVRDFLKELQRSIASQRPSILEGRDIGTVIFPDAALKFFLTADSKIRAQRRLEQLKEKDPNNTYSLDEILADIIKRDKTDAEREIAPLVKASDAIEVDTTAMNISEVVATITQHFEQNKSLF